MKKKRIAFVIGQLGLGGSEKQLYLLVKGLNRDAFDPIVITFNEAVGDFWENEIRSLKVPLLRVKQRPGGVFRVLDFGQKLWSTRPDIVVSWSLYLNFISSLIARVLLGKPAISSIRCDLFNNTTPKMKLHRFLGTKFASLYVANSSAGKDDLMNKVGLPEHKVKVIFNAVTDIATTFNRGGVREKFLIPNSKFVILNIGRLEPGKNQMMLLRVLKMLKEQGIADITVAFIGKGPDVDTLRLFSEKNGLIENVYFLGSVPNACNFFAAFDLLCHCSVGEGMPNVLAEAALMGLPIITTEVNGVTDIVIDGESGYCIAQNDDAGMRDRILNLYHNPNLRKMMAASAKSHMLSEKFSVGKMLVDFERIFNE